MEHVPYFVILKHKCGCLLLPLQDKYMYYAAWKK